MGRQHPHQGVGGVGRQPAGQRAERCGRCAGRPVLSAHLPHGRDQGQTRLLVYDTERGLWHEEDVCSCDMASTGGQLYLWDGQALWAADPSRESDWQSTEGVEQQVSFELVTGDIGQDGAEQRYLSRLTLRLDAACASTVEVALSYDGGPWETVASLTAREARRSYDLPLVPRRHSTLRLRLRGKGQITLRSLAKNLAAAKGGLVEEQEEATWQV